MRSFIAIPVITVALASALTACGEDEPAVCGSVKSLDASVKKVKAIDVTSSGAISDLRSGLTAVGGDLRDVKDDAKSEFAEEIDAVEARSRASVQAWKTAKDDTTGHAGRRQESAVRLRHRSAEPHHGYPRSTSDPNPRRDPAKTWGAPHWGSRMHALHGHLVCG